jgi:hypothetical protein
LKFASNAKAKCILKYLKKEEKQNNGELMCPINQPRKKELKLETPHPL